MEWTISIMVLSVWFIGVLMPYTFHGHLHLLLVLAVAVVLIPIYFNKRHKPD